MTDLSGLKDFAIVVIGNLFIIILLIRVIGSWAKRDYTDLFTNLVLAVVIAFLVYANDQAVALLQQLATMAFGGGA
ncbi:MULTISPECIES: hypothetical protein [Kocuria]|uniref:hypothetical protein n=1 Tax=Kocuria TaxID=57493 RepID=UPI0002FD8835|nr:MULTISPECIES: hypothetical protein [Kocuria]